MTQEYYTIEELIELAKDEKDEFGYATEKQMYQVVDIFNKKGLCGNNLEEIWFRLQDEFEYLRYELELAQNCKLIH